jgi:hypothetical protein
MLYHLVIRARSRGDGPQRAAKRPSFERRRLRAVAAGSVAVGVWIARIVFVILVVNAVVEERYRVAVGAVVLAGVGWLTLSRVNADLITPFLAIVDIGLVFIVHGRDIRLN